MSLAVGDRIGDLYEVIGMIGAGGMGQVAAARDLQISRTVAIKTLLPGAGANRELVLRFRQEIETTARLKSRYIPTVFNCGALHDGTLWMAMELLEGVTLARLVRDLGGRMTVELAMEYMTPVLAGVRTAHAHKVIHRDLKPENVFVERTADGENVKILDFGIAKVKDESERLQQTKSGVQMGTLGYMSPEALRGHPVNETTDVYSLGVILFQLTTGRHPYQEEATVDEFLDAVATSRGFDLYERMQKWSAPDVRGFNPEIPEAFARVVQSMLAFDRRKRPQSVTEVLVMLAASVPNGSQLLNRYAIDLASRLPAAPSVPSPASRFVLGPRIGQGGTAEVFKGTLTGADRFARQVAIKRMRPELASNPRTASTLQREAQALALLSHQNIVNVLDFERTPDGSFLLALDLVEGCDAEALFRVGRVPPEIVEVIALKQARALAYVHSRGFVHKDVSLKNILLGWNGDVRLSDFGLARAAPVDGENVSETVRGTPRYMAPEIAKQQGGDARADLWSLGTVLHELLTGQPLFTGEQAEALFQVVTRDIPRPSTVKGVGRVPRDFETIVMRLLERDPAKRYQTADELIADIAKCEDLRTLGADHEGAVTRFLAARFPASMRDANNLGTPPPDEKRTSALGAVSTLGSTASQRMPGPRTAAGSSRGGLGVVVAIAAVATACGFAIAVVAHNHRHESRPERVASTSNEPVATTDPVPEATRTNAPSTPGVAPAPPSMAPASPSGSSTAPAARPLLANPPPPSSSGLPARTPPPSSPTSPSPPRAGGSSTTTPPTSGLGTGAPATTQPTTVKTSPPPSPPSAPVVAERSHQTGTLFVSVDPSWAECYVDGRDEAHHISSTPCQKTLSAGAHQLYLVNPQMHINKSEKVVIVPNKQTTINENW